jgi:hypothetical protein
MDKLKAVTSKIDAIDVGFVLLIAGVCLRFGFAWGLMVAGTIKIASTFLPEK